MHLPLSIVKFGSYSPHPLLLFSLLVYNQEGKKVEKYACAQLGLPNRLIVSVCKFPSQLIPRRW